VSAHLGVALHHDVVDVGLQGHADILPLPSVKLENVEHPRHPHLEENGLAAAAKLHRNNNKYTVQFFLGRSQRNCTLANSKENSGTLPISLRWLECVDDKLSALAEKTLSLSVGSG